MTRFSIHTEATAPTGSREILASLVEAVGFAPNVYGVVAASPAALEGLAALNAAFARSSLTEAEREVVQLAASAENGCRYCVAGHTVFAAAAGIDDETIRAARLGLAVAEPRLEALHRFTRALVRERGHVDADAVEAFLAAGFTRAEAIEVVLGVACKFFTNLAATAFDVPIDAAFQPEARRAAQPAAERSSVDG